MHLNGFPMKSIICFPLVLLFLSSCGKNQYRPRAELYIQKPGSKVEKAWVARNRFDQERRLLIPKLGGARWGAVQEYKEDGTIEFKDWWERDVKIEDLEASPSTVISKSWGKKKPTSPALPRLGLDQPLDLVPSSAPLPPFGLPPQPTDAASGIPELPALPPLGDPSALPPIDGPALPPIDGPALPPIDGPALPSVPVAPPAPSPFAPLPGALPGTLPEIGAPNNELPEAPPDAELPEAPPGAELPEAPPGAEPPPAEGNPLPELPADPFQNVP